MNKSLWLDNYKSNINKLNKDIECDVLIIGGGITGISTAYHLINSNLKVCLTESNLVGSGVTGRTTGKITYLQELIYYKIKKFISEEISLNYLTSQIEAVNLIKNIVVDNNINCNFTKVTSYLFTNRKNEISKIKKQKQLFEKLNIKVKESTNIPLDIKCQYTITIDDTYVFHPIKYLLKLKEIIIKNNINVYEKTKIVSIDRKDNKYICKTDNNTIITKKVVIASHYPFFLFPFFMPTKTSIEKSYISASNTNDLKKFAAINTSIPTKSVRYHSDSKNYLIYLNSSHKTCLDYDENKNFNKLIHDTKKLGLSPNYIWSNHDIMTYDYLPFIGKIEKDNDKLLLATGYNTWGMTNGSLAGLILSDIILGNKNKYEKLFNPLREINNSKIFKFPLYLSMNAKAFLDNKLYKKKDWYENIQFKTINKKQIAIYTDENKKEHIVYTACPHLKCNLIFNDVEKTWDCPCHGSKFDIDGNIILGPSNKNIKYDN